MATYKRTVQDFAREATHYLLSRRDLDFHPEEVGETVVFTIFRDDAELGRLIYSPVLEGFGGEVNCQVECLDGLMSEHGRELWAIAERIKSAVDWMHEMRNKAAQERPVSDDTFKRGGRPPSKDDDWAYQEIKSGRDPEDVYKEWLERIPEKRRSNLVDHLASFKSAMRYRRKREKRD